MTTTQIEVYINSIKIDLYEVELQLHHNNDRKLITRLQKYGEIKEESYMRRERRYGAFSRSLALPEGVNTDNAEAEFEDGVLKLTIPKAPEAQPKTIKVKGKEKK